ncbi:hypothetical protein AX334_19595 [Salmonella enterica]|nr:hypothetical protein [Salmonella enterica]
MSIDIGFSEDTASVPSGSVLTFISPVGVTVKDFCSLVTVDAPLVEITTSFIQTKQRDSHTAGGE